MSNSLAFDANKTLKNGVDRLMGSASNALCPTIAASYIMLNKLAFTMTGPASHMLELIKSALNENPVLDLLESASRNLEIINNGLAQLNFQIDKDTIYALNIFNKICLDFNDLLPDKMKGFLDDAMDMINEGFEGTFELPDSVQDLLSDAQDCLFDEALSEGFDLSISLVLSPLVMYRNFLKSSGILDFLKKMQKFERCMTNPETCNRPKKEFYYPGTNKYNSQYYMDLLCTNLEGEILLSKLSDQFKSFEGKVYKTFKKLDEFKKSPISS